MIDVGGVRLEVEIVNCNPASAETRKCRLAVICHPYQCLGGSMHDLTVDRLFHLASESGLFDQVMRYNSRGVGNSEGWMNFTYQADGRDLACLIEQVLKEKNERKDFLIIAYSYGSCVAAEAIKRLEILNPYSCLGLLSIGWPLGLVSRLFLGSSTALDTLFSILRLPADNGRASDKRAFRFLIVLGENDQFTCVSQAQEQMDARLKSNEHTRQLSASISVIPGADHFFFSFKPLSSVCLEWLHELPEHQQYVHDSRSSLAQTLTN